MSAVLIDIVWQDRIISSSAFSRTGRVSIGGAGSDVDVPFLPSGSRAHIFDLRDWNLAPGETVKIPLPGNLLFLSIRQVGLTAKAQPDALLDLSVTELAGLLLALAFTTVFGTLMKMRAPEILNTDSAREENPVRKVTVVFNRKPIAIETAELVQPAIKKVAPSRPTPRPQHPYPARDSVRRPVHMPGTTAASSGGLLGAFGSKGVRASLERARAAGTGLTQAADQATGAGGRDAHGIGAHGFKDAGAAGGRDTVTIGGDPAGKIAPGYGASGLSRERIGISIGASADTEVSGGMDREAIRRVIREHIREIRSCYERELQSRPDLYGKLILQWDIETGGRVSTASVKSNSLGNERVAGCILQHLREWRFPEPPVNQIGRISYPFIFSSQ